MNALEIIEDAYTRCNKLTPGEPLSADDAAFALRKLNLLVDELSAKTLFLYKNVLTSAAQTGHITLGVGDWAAIDPGSEIVSATCDGMPMDPITMQQYNAVYMPGTVGTPSLYAHDGLSTVYLVDVPNGQTIKLQTRTTVTAFADMATEYTAPPGFKAALGAGLAVRIAPTIAGGVTADMLRAEKAAMGAINVSDPAIVDVHSFSGGGIQYPARLF